MTLTIIQGSNRENSESSRVASFVSQNLNKIITKETIDIIDLNSMPLPLFNGKPEIENPNFIAIKNTLEQSDGFVLITPEWGGMASIAVKNLLQTFRNNQFGHKPALIISVSSGRGGAFPVAELRLNSFKNNHLCFIPEQVIIRDVNNLVLKYDDQELGKTEIFIRNRIDYCLKVLVEYTKALILVRNSGVIDFEKFGNGMS